MTVRPSLPPRWRLPPGGRRRGRPPPRRPAPAGAMMPRQPIGSRRRHLAHPPPDTPVREAGRRRGAASGRRLPADRPALPLASTAVTAAARAGEGFGSWCLPRLSLVGIEDRKWPFGLLASLGR